MISSIPRNKTPSVGLDSLIGTWEAFQQHGDDSCSVIPLFVTFLFFIFSKLNVFSSSLTCLGWYTGIRQFDISEMTFTLSRFDAILISCLIANPNMIPNIPKVHKTEEVKKNKALYKRKRYDWTRLHFITINGLDIGGIGRKQKQKTKIWFWYIKFRGGNKASGIDKKDRTINTRNKTKTEHAYKGWIPQSKRVA